MHPDISKLPSRLFYGGRLLDGPGMSDKTQQPWHVNPMFHPYRFFDVRDGNEEAAVAGHSLMNRGECRVAVSLYRRLKTEFSRVDFDFRIGVVSMYRAQIQQLKNAFRTEFGKDIVGKIDFSTVDGFQGQEKDIIILSCVRGGPSVTSVGFLRDERRMNVSITRARSNLFILGHAATLERSDDFWRQIVQDARERGSLIQVSTHVLRGKIFD
jgi:senataxin